ncbi:MAG: hypothetical protein WD873_07345, partial [Candidatus Hydrogenedentales bacterium]
MWKTCCQWFFLTLLGATSAFAQLAETQTVTRADLAGAYLRLEAALAEVETGAELRAKANKLFDEATLAFFSGKMAEAVATVNR